MVPEGAIRIGVVGVDGEHAEEYLLALRQLQRDQSAPRSEVTHLCGDDPDRLAALTGEFAIRHRTTDLRGLLADVDGVMIVEDSRSPARHVDFAEPFLRAGVPTFVDKPMAPSVADATRMVRWARSSGAPLMSGSALRFDPAMDAARSDLADHPAPVSITCLGPGPWFSYGVHLVEALQELRSCPPKSVTLLRGHNGSEHATLGYADGLVASIKLSSDPTLDAMKIDVDCGRRVLRYTFGPDYRPAYRRTAEAFVQMCKTRRSPVGAASMVAVIEVLCAGEQSATTGTPIAIGCDRPTS